jgi:hypothetical protein
MDGTSHACGPCLTNRPASGPTTAPRHRGPGTWDPIITAEEHEALLVVLGSVRPSGEPRAAR